MPFSIQNKQVSFSGDPDIPEPAQDFPGQVKLCPGQDSAVAGTGNDMLPLPAAAPHHPSAGPVSRSHIFLNGSTQNIHPDDLPDTLCTLHFLHTHSSFSPAGGRI